MILHRGLIRLLISAKTIAGTIHIAGGASRDSKIRPHVTLRVIAFRGEEDRCQDETAAVFGDPGLRAKHRTKRRRLRTAPAIGHG